MAWKTGEELKGDNVIDSRDIISRLEDLQNEKEELAEALEAASEALAEAVKAEDEALAEWEEAERASRTDEGAEALARALEAGKAHDATQDARHDAEQAEKEARQALEEWEAEHAEELRELEELNEEGEQYASDWEHGATLILESHFVDYCRELVEDVGDLPRGLPRYLVIDWEATADNLRVDYSELDFGGYTYLVR